MENSVLRCALASYSGRSCSSGDWGGRSCSSGDWGGRSWSNGAWGACCWVSFFYNDNDRLTNIITPIVATRRVSEPYRQPLKTFTVSSLRIRQHWASDGRKNQEYLQIRERYNYCSYMFCVVCLMTVPQLDDWRQHRNTAQKFLCQNMGVITARRCWQCRYRYERSWKCLSVTYSDIPHKFTENVCPL